jgi:hypothetical protein
MAVIDPERTLPRSALRYRPVSVSDQAQLGRLVRRPCRHVPDDLEREPARRASPRSIAPVQRVRPRWHLHPLFLLGLVLLVATLLWVGMTQALTWGTNELNTLKYGEPRTFQIDAVVGQGDSAQYPSHFIAVNLRGTVTILEFPAGDASHARVLASTSLIGPDANQAVVTLHFVDLNHDGRPTMLIDIDGVQSILVNDGTTFRPPTPPEHQSILQALQQIKG